MVRWDGYLCLCRRIYRPESVGWRELCGRMDHVDNRCNSPSSARSTSDGTNGSLTSGSVYPKRFPSSEGSLFLSPDRILRKPSAIRRFSKKNLTNSMPLGVDAGGTAGFLKRSDRPFPCAEFMVFFPRSDRHNRR